jgi:hypothetical protein
MDVAVLPSGDNLSTGIEAAVKAKGLKTQLLPIGQSLEY